jgi:hypothetical protein
MPKLTLREMEALNHQGAGFTVRSQKQPGATFAVQFVADDAVLRERAKGLVPAGAKVTEIGRTLTVRDIQRVAQPTAEAWVGLSS